MIAAIAASTSASAERPVRRLERQPEGEALLVGRERAAAIDVEQPQAGERRTGGGADRGRDVARRDVLRHDDREVALARPGSAAAATAMTSRAGRRRGPSRSSSATTTRASRRSQSLGDRRVELADDAGERERAVAPRPRRAPPARDGAAARRVTGRYVGASNPRRAAEQLDRRPSRRRGRTAASGRFQAAGSAAPVARGPSRHHSRGVAAAWP